MDVVPVLERPITKILGRGRCGGWSNFEARRMELERRTGRRSSIVRLEIMLLP